MSKGGYNGGSTIIGPWSTAWFSTGSRRGKATTEAQQQTLAGRIVVERADQTAKAAAKAAKQSKKAAGKLAAKAAAEKQREMRARPAVKRAPEKVAERLERAMKGVEVRRYTANTLRARTPAD